MEILKNEIEREKTGILIYAYIKIMFKVWNSKKLFVKHTLYMLQTENRNNDDWFGTSLNASICAVFLDFQVKISVAQRANKCSE